MTATQPELPAIDWTDLDRLCDLGAAQLHDPVDPQHLDLRGQGLTAYQINTMTDVDLQGDLL